MHVKIFNVVCDAVNYKIDIILVFLMYSVFVLLQIQSLLMQYLSVTW